MKRTFCLLFAITIFFQSLNRAEALEVAGFRQGVTESQAEEDFYPSQFQKLKQEAENGIAEAQYILGCMYQWGKGVPGNYREKYSEAMYWYKKSAEQGHPRAQVSLGNMYANNDESEAQRWWEMAARHYKQKAQEGDAEAQYQLGEMYSEGHGVPRNITEAIYWCQKAAEQGNHDAKWKLEVFQAERNHVMKMREAAKKGDVEAQLWFGLRHGLHSNYYTETEAIEWLKKAAFLGNTKAQSELGNVYAMGKSVKQNYNEAAKWWQKAAEYGSIEAKRSLGGMYARGDGVPQDYIQAHMWFNLAAAQDPLYIRTRESVAKGMTKEQIAQAQRLAREWLKTHPQKSKP